MSLTLNFQDDPSGAKALWSRGNLNGASQKAETVANFFIGDMVTAIQKTTLIPGGNECIIYATMSGRIGILVPFNSSEDSDFFQVNYACMALEVNFTQFFELP